MRFSLSIDGSLATRPTELPGVPHRGDVVYADVDGVMTRLYVRLVIWHTDPSMIPVIVATVDP